MPGACQADHADALGYGHCVPAVFWRDYLTPGVYWRLDYDAVAIWDHQALVFLVWQLWSLVVTTMGFYLACRGLFF
jgi:hypothetical protein